MLKQALLFFCLICAAPLVYGQTEDTTGNITLDFEEVDIRDLIRFMAETTGYNFIIDKSVKGKVSVISPSEMTKDEALEVFETLLVSSNFAITETKTKNVYRILPASSSIKTPISLARSSKSHRPSQLITEIVALTHANVGDITPIIKPLLTEQGHFSSYQPKNMIMLTESAANIQRIKKLIRRLDQPIGDKGNVHVMQLNNADVIQVADILERIFLARRLPQNAQKVEIIPEAATNTLLIVADQAQLNEIQNLVSELDAEASDNVRAVEIVYLRHANAVDLANVLNEIIENNDDDGSDFNQGSNSNVLEDTTFRGEISVVADNSINALVLSAEPTDMLTLKDVIDRLDIRRLQVYIEALVMEVSSDVSDQFGVEWRSADDFTSGDSIGVFGGTNFQGNINALSANPLSLPSGMSFGLVGQQVSFRGEEFANIGLLVNALKSDSNFNVLATPQLMTLDNEEAEIIVGDNVPFVTGSFTTTADGANNPFQTIEREDVGLTLTIKPQISENGFIRMDIYQEISSIGQQGSAADLVTRKRSLRTAVVVPNQSMLALGGLIREDIIETYNRVPCLSSLWGVGELFRSSSVQNTKTNLMVFIKPVIINTFGDAKTLTHQKYREMRNLQRDRQQIGSRVVPVHTIGEPSIIPDHLRDENQGARRPEMENSDIMQDLPALEEIATSVSQTATQE